MTHPIWNNDEYVPSLRTGEEFTLRAQRAFLAFWSNYFKLDGKTARMDFWVPTGVLLLVLGVAPDLFPQSDLWDTLVKTLGYACFIPQATCLARRLRDSGLPAALALLYILPLPLVTLAGAGHVPCAQRLFQLEAFPFGSDTPQGNHKAASAGTVRSSFGFRIETGTGYGPESASLSLGGIGIASAGAGAGGSPASGGLLDARRTSRPACAGPAGQSGARASFTT